MKSTRPSQSSKFVCLSYITQGLTYCW